MKITSVICVCAVTNSWRRLPVVARGAVAHHARAEDLVDGVGPTLLAGSAEPADAGRGRPGDGAKILAAVVAVVA